MPTIKDQCLSIRYVLRIIDICLFLLKHCLFAFADLCISFALIPTIKDLRLSIRYELRIIDICLFVLKH